MSDSLLLTPDELIAITGYRRPRDQIAWITRHYAIPAYVNMANAAVVVRAHLEAAQRPVEKPRDVRLVREVRS